MKPPLLKPISFISALLLTATACAQPATSTDENIKMTQSAAADKVSADTDSHLRQVLTEVGIKAQILSIEPSNLPNMYQVNLAGQPPLHITADGKYVIQGDLQKNPSPRKVKQTPARATSAQAGEYVSAAVKSSLLENMSALKNMSAKNAVFLYRSAGRDLGRNIRGRAVFTLR